MTLEGWVKERRIRSIRDVASIRHLLHEHYGQPLTVEQVTELTGHHPAKVKYMLGVLATASYYDPDSEHCIHMTADGRFVMEKNW